VVNHCRSHCRLARFRGLVYWGKHSVVIGPKRTHPWPGNLYFGHIEKYAFLDQSHRCISPRTSYHGVSRNDSVSDSG
jgi:hypothetical protein